ncbi:MAG: VOC family protein [Armatimonadetes bacterium]|nr:VOC family protein [Armatimonadota bacterium]
MDRSVNYYTELLGQAPAMVSPHWSEFELDGGTKLGLHGGRHGEDRGVNNWVLCLATPDMKATLARLKEHGIEMEGHFDQTPSGLLATFHDPDGNVIQFIDSKATIETVHG